MHYSSNTRMLRPPPPFKSLLFPFCVLVSIFYARNCRYNLSVPLYCIGGKLAFCSIGSYEGVYTALVQ
ncbi:hypothetical protein EDC04DRAFT_2703173 [Pisolithus marmoratus]|nr:hypothetical protein EDC04DRAFT_2703173 [Pisolithus marmoratus]